MYFRFLGIVVLQCMMSCHPTLPENIDVQGHRGCRGLFPENTMIGFQNAAALGVTTLEMDVVINKDNEVIVSHEPWYRADITTLPNGAYLLPADEQQWRIYHMRSDEMKSLDVGLRHPDRFPRQKAVKATKPTLIEVFQEFAQTDMKYNIEIKRTALGDGILHPEVKVYVDLVVQVIRQYDLFDKVTFQSFDMETLQELKKKFPFANIAFLTNDKYTTFSKNIKKLGFKPDIYSPQHSLVTIPLINLCHRSGVKIIPWTVNHQSVMRKFIRWGVDGMITDYPNLLLEIVPAQ